MRVYAGTLVFAYTYNLFGHQTSYTPDADIDGSVSTIYFRGIGLIFSENAGVRTYYHQNAHGDVIMLTDGQGNIIKTYEYDAFGVEWDAVDTDNNPFRYCGEYFDKETKTVYLRARYYDSAYGRFTQQDGWEYANYASPLSLNLYTYCWNDPVNMMDFNGHSAHDVLIGIVSAIDENYTRGFITWLAECITGVSGDHIPDDEFDYYLGRVIGDILCMAGSIKEMMAGLKLIMSSIVAGGATTFASGGTLAIGGVAICVEGVVAGAVVTAHGMNVLEYTCASFMDDWEKMSQAHSARDDGIKNVYNSIKESPNYPEGFTPRKNGTTVNKVKNKELLDELRKVEPGEWNKVYKDGYDAYGNKVSIHYFQSSSGKVFDVQVKPKWSNK